MKKLEKEGGETGDKLTAVTTERDALKKKAAALDNMGKEMERLTARAADAEQLEKDVAALNANVATLERQYTEQNALRKKCVASSDVLRAQRNDPSSFAEVNGTKQHNTTQHNTLQHNTNPSFASSLQVLEHDRGYEGQDPGLRTLPPLR